MLDNLDTHTKGAFCEASGPAVARAYLKRIEFVFTQDLRLDDALVAPGTGHLDQRQSADGLFWLFAFRARV